MTGKGNRLSHSDHGPAKSGKSHKFVNQDSAFDYPYSPSNYFRQPIMFNGQDTSFVYEGDNQVIQQNLKMLSKKSDQTRLRGIKEIYNEVAKMNEIEVAQLISPFIYYYEQLLFSNDKQVRYTANQLMKLIGTKSPKGFKPYMSTLIGVWYMYMNDVYDNICKEAKSTFELLIPEKQQKSIISKYSNEIQRCANKYIYINDTILEKKCSGEDAISECKERLHITGLNVYVSLFQSLENYEDSFLSLCYSYVVQTMPTTLQSSSIPLVTSCLTFLSSLYTHIPFSQFITHLNEKNADELIPFKKSVCSILKMIGTILDVSLQKTVLGTWMNLIIKWPEVWSYANHDDCVLTLIKKLKNPSVDSNYFLENYELFLQLLLKMKQNTYNHDTFAFYSLFLNTFYQYIQANEDLNYYYFLDYFITLKYIMQLDTIPSAMESFYKHVFMDQENQLIHLFEQYANADHVLHQLFTMISDTFILCYHYSSDLFTTILHSFIQRMTISYDPQPSVEENKRIDALLASDSYLPFFQLYYSVLEQAEPELKCLLQNTFKQYFEDFFKSTLCQHPNVYYHKRLRVLFRRIHTLSSLPLEIQANVYPCDIEPTTYLIPLFSHAFQQIETSNYNTQQDTFIIEPLYSLLEDLFPIFKYKNPDQSDTITTILILIYNLLVTTDCDELYKFDLYSQFLSHPSLFDLNQEYLGEKEQYSYLQHINHYVDSIFMNDHYVLFMPKLGIYCSILDRIIQCPYLYENNETLLYLLINPIFSNIDNYSVKNILILFTTIHDSIYSLKSHKEEMVNHYFTHIYELLLQFIYNNYDKVKHIDHLCSQMHDYYKTDFYPSITPYILTVDTIIQDSSLTTKDIDAFLFSLSILDRETCMEVSSSFYSEDNLQKLFTLTFHFEHIITTVLSLYPSLYLPSQMSLKGELMIYLLAQAYHQEEMIKKYPSILTVMETTTFDYFSALNELSSLYYLSMKYNNYTLLNTIRSTHMLFLKKCCNERKNKIHETEDPFSIHVSSFLLHHHTLIKEHIQNDHILNLLSIYLYQYTKTLYQNCHHTVLPYLADIRLDYLYNYLSFFESYDSTTMDHQSFATLVILTSLYSEECVITEEESEQLQNLVSHLSTLYSISSSRYITYLSKLLYSLLLIQNHPVYPNTFYIYGIPIVNKSIQDSIETSLSFYLYLHQQLDHPQENVIENLEGILQNQMILLWSQLNSIFDEFDHFVHDPSLCEQFLENKQLFMEEHSFMNDLTLSYQFYQSIHTIPKLDLTNTVARLFEIFSNPALSVAPEFYIHIFYFIYWIMNLENPQLLDIKLFDYVKKSIQLFITHFDDYSYEHQLYFSILISTIQLVTENNEAKIDFYESVDIKQYISLLLPVIMPNIPFVHISSRSKPEPPTLSLSSLSSPLDLDVFSLTSISLFSLLQSYPSLVRSWWLTISTTENQTALTLQYFIEIYLNSPLITKEYAIFKKSVMKLHIPSIEISLISNQIHCVIPFDDTFIRFTITVPFSYPLHIIEMNMNSTNIISKAKFQKWKLQLFNYHDINMSLSTCLYNFFNSIQKSLNGVEPCPICYCVIHPGTNELPDTKCKQCVGVFHRHCLYKWFVTSGGNTCPLCRQHMIIETVKQ